MWRRLAVPPSLTLRDLHAVLQTAMGWKDYHLHLFEADGVLYGDVEDFPGELGDEEATTVADVAARGGTFRYQYDFGDGWEHDLSFGRTPAPAGPAPLPGRSPRLPAGGLRGVPGRLHLLDVLADRAGAQGQDAELLEWLGDDYAPESVHVAGTEQLLELYERHPGPRRRP